MKKCPECNGRDSDTFYDIEDYYPCYLCDGHGMVEENTKTALENLLLHKENN